MGCDSRKKGGALLDALAHEATVSPNFRRSCCYCTGVAPLNSGVPCCYFPEVVTSYQQPPPMTRRPTSVRRWQPVKSSCSILSQQMASDLSPMFVMPLHPLTLSSRRAVVCLATHHNPTSVTYRNSKYKRRSILCL